MGKGLGTGYEGKISRYAAQELKLVLKVFF